MYAGTIESVRDDTSDRFYVLRRDIDQIQAEAERFAAEQDALLHRQPASAAPALQ
jgi:hypothetical protein